ncbi:RagB/SusD family nutrient uptake outer membrane protein [Chitinophaga sp. SYP-B3965]|uniref:RagB/SusD family nutrient uptake outer membrane protein n=1 Tax=Chitinophaga sp. SYP-B3965 TaxID=2663120 RepID=UPI001299C9C5|nr:RagB/SusD family nutrient uptake outer membrane protein [Chitinophaga sp. SYP-B3965]MRG44393.1 RagB/SusD family nutrient uptake outer membrane protein [Chitinophaga sp. SYP-B3965]
MLYKRYLTGFIALGCLAISACNKYLDITPKGFTILSTVNNYDQWLNDADKLGASATAELNLLADNVDNVNIKVPAVSANELVYTWAPQFNTDLKAAPACWGAHYANINKYNTVLLGIDDATGGTPAAKRALKAEALLGRAFEYFYLVNLYGKPYDPATADKDLGVPFVTSNDVTQQVPGRSTVKEIYDHIIADISTALPDLAKDNSKNRYRGSVPAAYSVLARVYLYMRNYPEASKNAALAIQTGTLSMLDFRTTLPNTVSSLSTRQDAIYSRRLMGYESPDSAFLSSFSKKDLRLALMYSSSDNYSRRGNTTYFPLITNYALQSTNTGTSLPEMKLIIAEAAARATDLTTALTQLNEIRVMRFATADYQPLQSGDQEEVLAWVLRERNNEMPYSGLRWFDMRRLDKEEKMPVVNRYDARGNIIATLPHAAAAYTLKIPVQVLYFNPGMQQN